jgi:pimeloyl-ACP methyl ester carboxylesterase
MRHVTALLLCAVLFAACSAPVGTKRLSPRDQQRALASNALTTDEPSDAAQIVLRRHNLAATFEDQPELALVTLRAVALAEVPRGDELFALAELSYRYAEESGSQPYALAASLYAYAFLFPTDPEARPSPIDARLRWAADIYAAGLSRALADKDSKTLVLRSTSLVLPWGTLEVAVDTDEMEWSGRRLSDFVPTAQYELYGLNNRYRQPGIGVPLAAKPLRASETETETEGDLVAETVRVPVTAVLLVDDPRQQISEALINGRLDLLLVDEHDSVLIDGVAVPLEIDRSATLAVTLAEVGFWRQELSSFLGDALGTRKTAALTARQPYRPGRIPLVMVHGTNSSPGRWADMVNDLENDPRIRARYQFWFFSYDSGNPIAYSAMLLRRALTAAVKRFDPEQRDACLQEMVVIGHSQGGLLTKMTVIESGNAFWENVSDAPFEDASLSDQSRALLKDALFIEPLPFISRVIFVSTPHHGSYLASPQIITRLAARLISMPRDVVGLGTDIFRDPSNHAFKMQRLPTSLDNMSPSQPFIKTLAPLPIAPDVPAHSIIPVLGDGPLEDEVDGVVQYKSAHIEGVESELVVHHSGHSTQGDPRTVDEVRRILLEHVAEAPCGLKPLKSSSQLQPGSTRPRRARAH